MGAHANHKKIAILATNGVDAIELGVVSEALTNAFFQTKLIESIDRPNQSLVK